MRNLCATLHSLRMLTHKPTRFRALSGAHPMRPYTGQIWGCVQRFWISVWNPPNSDTPTSCLPLQNTILTTTGILSQHATALPNPQHLFLDSLYSHLPNWSGHPQFHIYKNLFKQHAIQLKHNTTIYKTINSGANMHPSLGSPEVEISVSHPSWLLSASGCATRHGMHGCLFWLWTWHMRLCARISRYISWIHL